MSDETIIDRNIASFRGSVSRKSSPIHSKILGSKVDGFDHGYKLRNIFSANLLATKASNAAARSKADSPELEMGMARGKMPRKPEF